MRRLFILLTLTFISFSAFSQNECELQNLSYEIIHDGELFYFYVSEPNSETLLEHYSVFINEEEYESGSGEFGPFFGDCETNYTLQLTHKSLDFCHITSSVGPICKDTSDCFIGEITYSYPECVPGDSILVEIDFEHKGTSESFLLRGNGNFYGEYKYSELPISVPVVPLCNQVYEFAVIDAQRESCRSAIGGIVICCPDVCDRPEFEIVSTECSDSVLFMKIRSMDGPFGTNITVQINEEYISDYRIDGEYLYLESYLPLFAVLNTLTVCNVGFADVCCFSADFFADGCAGNSCGISNLRYEIEDCDFTDGVYINVDFKYSESVSDSFYMIGLSPEKELYSYADLPIRLGPFPSACDVVYDLEVRDSEQDSCLAVLRDVFICCGQGCLDPIFEIIDSQCDSSVLYTKLQLIHPLPNDELVVTINGIPVIDYQLDFPYLYLQYPLTGTDEKLELQICTFGGLNTRCCYSQAFDLSDCSGNEECKIGDIIIEPYACIDTGIPGFSLDFEYSNVGAEGFTVKGNGTTYGNFRYSELPIFIDAEDNCDIFYEFVVIDNEYECYNFIEYGTYCCNNQCSFRAKEQRVKCENGIITEVAFFLEEDTDPLKEYQVYVNGSLVGETSENNIFLEFETQIQLTGNQRPVLTICDTECCVEYELEISNCIEEPVPCSISEVSVSAASCGDSGVNFTLNFKHEGTTSRNFDVFSLLGYFGTYSYDDLPLKVENFPNINLGLNVLFICDQGTFCCQAHLFNTPQCLEVIGEGEVSKVSDVEKEEPVYLIQNPATEYIQLRSPVQINDYQFFDSSGQRIKSQQSLDKLTTLETSDLKPGLYIVRIENELGVKIEKLIIAK